MQARDLEADLAICEAATPGPWVADKSTVKCQHYTLLITYCGGQKETAFAAEAREGWPYAIRRALAAEAEVDRLRDEIRMLQEQLEQRRRGCPD
jgi:hypothetical protein